MVAGQPGLGHLAGRLTDAGPQLVREDSHGASSAPLSREPFRTARSRRLNGTIFSAIYKSRNRPAGPRQAGTVPAAAPRPEAPPPFPGRPARAAAGTRARGA